MQVPELSGAARVMDDGLTKMKPSQRDWMGGLFGKRRRERSGRGWAKLLFLFSFSFISFVIVAICEEAGADSFPWCVWSAYPLGMDNLSKNGKEIK